MNTRLLLSFLLILFLINCTNPKTKTTSIDSDTTSKINTDTNPIEQKATSDIPENVDDKFETFLKYFNNDSVFQISRINFPLKIKISESQTDTTLSEISIPLTEFKKVDFTYDQSYSTRQYDKYNQKVIVTGNKAAIQIRGIDNGIYVDYEFEKKNGKWLLKTWTDKSN